MSCELSLGSPSFHQVLLSVKSLTHVCLSEFFVVETKAALFHIWHGKQKAKEAEETQRAM